jgi:predicted nucleic acid-binding Zn ribbon protein
MSPEHLPQSVRTPPVIPSCPICGEPLQGRQTVCSPKCRTERSRRKGEAKRRERDAQVRLLLTTAIEAATEAQTLLKPETEPAW